MSWTDTEIRPGRDIMFKMSFLFEIPYFPTSDRSMFHSSDVQPGVRPKFPFYRLKVEVLEQGTCLSLCEILPPLYLRTSCVLVTGALEWEPSFLSCLAGGVLQVDWSSPRQHLLRVLVCRIDVFPEGSGAVLRMAYLFLWLPKSHCVCVCVCIFMCMCMQCEDD